MRPSALPAWDETDELNASAQVVNSALPAFDETAPLEGEIVDPRLAPPPSKTESFLRGGAQGVSLGFADELTGAIRSPFTEKTYEEERDASRAAYDLAQEENPLTFMGGQAVGGAAGALATPGLAVGKGAALLAKGAAMGAAQGIGESEGELLSVDTAKQAALSGIIGGGLNVGASKLARAVTSPEILDDVAMSQGRRALGFTKRLQNTPLKEAQADAATRLALDENVIKPFAEPAAMQETAEGIAKGAGERMGAFLEGQSAGARGPLKAGSAPRLREQFLFNPAEAIDDVNALRPSGLNMGENAKINSVVDNVIDTIKAEGTINAKGQYALRPIPWEQARALKTKIQGMANYDTAASREVNEMKKKLAGKVRDQFMSQVETAAEARGQGAAFDAFKGDVRRYGSAETLQDALQNRISSDQGNAVVGLRDVIAGAGAFGGTGSPAKAAATAAAFKVARRYGNQTISWSADRLSKAIQTSPRFQKWAPALRAAMSRGPQALAVTSFMLQQTDPMFTAALEEEGAQ